MLNIVFDISVALTSLAVMACGIFAIRRVQMAYAKVAIAKDAAGSSRK